MKIFVNGKEKILSPRGEILDELLNEVLQHEPLKEKTVARIKINGDEVPVGLSETLQTPVAQIEILEIEVSSLADIVDRNLANAQDYLAKLIPGMGKAVDLFRSGSEQEANKFFVNIIDGIEWFSQVIETVVEAGEVKGVDPAFNKNSIQERQNHQLEIMKQMVEANENKDWVFVADLLEYEILPFYQEWTRILSAAKPAGGNNGD